MASLRKKGKVWYVRVRDGSGRQREIKAGPDKSVANQIKRDLEGKIQRVKAGTLDPREADALEAERVPITQHIADYLCGMESRGCCKQHVEGVQKCLAWFLKETKVSRLSHLRPSLIQTALATLRGTGRSDQTVTHYATCIGAFSRWAWKDRRTRSDLLADLERPRVVTAKKRVELRPELTARLNETTRQGPLRRGMSGEDRSWLYALAVITGLRRGELQSLTPESFSLDGNPPAVSLPAVATKNHKEAIQPLPAHVVTPLRSWLASKPMGRSLWPPERNTALMLRNDLKAAGINPDAYCFHSLRHSFVTAIVQCGGSVKDSMELARHHDAELTFGRYAHTRLEDLSKLVDRMPDLLSHTLPTTGVSMGSNGSTLGTTKPCPGRSQVDPLGHDHQRPGLVSETIA